MKRPMSDEKEQRADDGAMTPLNGRRTQAPEPRPPKQERPGREMPETCGQKGWNLGDGVPDGQIR